MTRLSDPATDLKQRYEILVIGSGYGGGVAASRLSRAKRQVCVLERGKEMQPSEYPDEIVRFNEETQWDLPERHLGSKTGLYDLRLNPDINVFVGCGLGGTSLINAGVSLRVLPRLFQDKRWPAEIRDDLGSGNGSNPYGRLDEYYWLGEEMLKPGTWPDSYTRLPKMEAVEKVAAALGLPFAPVPIAVTFDKLKNGLNHVGVPQEPRIGCGDCTSGCNYRAKNTVLMNYLPDAKNHGAEIYTTIASLPAHNRYRGRRAVCRLHGSSRDFSRSKS
jgi:cholesterol oxidase